MAAPRGEFRYQADTPAARQVLDGTYNYTEDFDLPTKELLDECAQVRTIIPDWSVNINLKRGGWQHRWGKAKEKTLSSVSGLQFSHYKAGAKSDLISHLHALKTYVALRRGVFLAEWPSTWSEKYIPASSQASPTALLPILLETLLSLAPTPP